jgi:hypothetical protein
MYINICENILCCSENNCPMKVVALLGLVSLNLYVGGTVPNQVLYKIPKNRVELLYDLKVCLCILNNVRHDAGNVLNAG